MRLLARSRRVTAPAADPRVRALEEQARALGFALVPLKLVDQLDEREATVSAAYERGRDGARLVARLGELAGSDLPSAVEWGSGLAAENASLRARVAQLAGDFALVAESLLLAEFPETALTTEDR